jgi:hypothetical protein
MAKCIVCGERYSDKLRRCPYCGEAPESQHFSPSPMPDVGLTPDERRRPGLLLALAFGGVAVLLATIALPMMVGGGGDGEDDVLSPVDSQASREPIEPIKPQSSYSGPNAPRFQRSSISLSSSRPRR